MTIFRIGFNIYLRTLRTVIILRKSLFRYFSSQEENVDLYIFNIDLVVSLYAYI